MRESLEEREKGRRETKLETEIKRKKYLKV